MTDIVFMTCVIVAGLLVVAVSALMCSSEVRFCLMVTALGMLPAVLTAIALFGI